MGYYSYFLIIVFGTHCPPSYLPSSTCLSNFQLLLVFSLVLCDQHLLASTNERNHSIFIFMLDLFHRTCFPIVSILLHVTKSHPLNRWIIVHCLYVPHFWVLGLQQRVAMALMSESGSLSFKLPVFLVYCQGLQGLSKPFSPRLNHISCPKHIAYSTLRSKSKSHLGVHKALLHLVLTLSWIPWLIRSNEQLNLQKQFY